MSILSSAKILGKLTNWLSIAIYLINSAVLKFFWDDILVFSKDLIMLLLSAKKFIALDLAVEKNRKNRKLVVHTDDQFSIFHDNGAYRYRDTFLGTIQWA